MSNFSGQSRGSPFKRDDPSKRRRSVSSSADHASVAAMSADEKRSKAIEMMKDIHVLLAQAEVEGAVDPSIPDARKGDKLPPATLLVNLKGVVPLKCCAVENHNDKMEMWKACKYTATAEFYPAHCKWCIKLADYVKTTGWAYITAAELETLNIYRELGQTAKALAVAKLAEQRAIDQDLAIDADFANLGLNGSMDEEDEEKSEAQVQHSTRSNFAYSEASARTSFCGTKSMASPVSSFYGSRASASEATFDDTASSVAWLDSTNTYMSDGSGYEDEDI